jgi:hypothetical protein
MADINHPTHTFGTVDDCIRCLDCEVLFCGLQSGTPCPARNERVEIASVEEIKLACKHNSIARCEETIPWCTDCRQYIDQQTGKSSTAPTLAQATRVARDGKPYFRQASPHSEVRELRYDVDSGRWL